MIKQKCAKLYDTNGGQWLLSAVCTAALYAFICAVAPVVFYINDDTNIMYTVAGYYTGTPADHYFIGIYLSWLLQGLYRLLPQVPWYGAAHVCGVALSAAVIDKAVLFRCRRRNISFWIPLTMIVCLSAMVFYPAGALIQFTVTAAMLGAAACAFLLCADAPEMPAKHRLLHVAGSGFLLLASFSFRLSSGKSACCFYAICLLFMLLRDLIGRRRAKKDHDAASASRKRLLLLSAAGIFSLLLAFSSPVVSDLVRNTPEWKSYFTYESARVRFTDYPHAKYDEAPELYESQGWSKALYNLAGRSIWFFMDERIDVAQFQAICGSSDASDASDTYGTPTVSGMLRTVSASPGGALQTIYSQLMKLWWSSYAAPAASVLIFAAGCFFLFNVFYHPRKEWLSLLGTFAILCIGGIMVLFLSWRQRLPLRAYQAILLPCTVSALLFLTDLFGKVRLLRRGSVPYFRVTAACLVIACAFGLSARTVKETKNLADSKVQRSAYTLSLEDYAIRHPDSLYVYDVGLTFRYMPFVTYPGQRPTNVIFWGGMGYRSPAFYQQLACNGLSELYCDQFLNPDKSVLYVTRDDYEIYSSPVSGPMLAYMDETYGSLGMRQEDTIGDHILVCRFLPAIDLSGEDGWVERYGVRYYIQNHALASGTVVIDGTTYQFEQSSSFQQITYEGQTYWLNMKGSAVSGG